MLVAIPYFDLTSELHKRWSVREISCSPLLVTMHGELGANSLSKMRHCQAWSSKLKVPVNYVRCSYRYNLAETENFGLVAIPFTCPIQRTNRTQTSAAGVVEEHGCLTNSTSRATYTVL